MNQTENNRYWEKDNFLLFAKCLKMYSFFAFAFKVCKKGYYEKKKNISMGLKKQNFILISNSLMPAFKKFKAKNHEKMRKNENTNILHRFLAIAFFRGICLSRHQRIVNQQKILRFFTSKLIFFTKKFFGVIKALFANFKCKCEKNCTFSNILQKVKRYFFPNIYHSPFDSQ
jgi:hypothetical protein